MPKAPYADDIEASRLRFDLKNPRLPHPPDSQREACGQMAEAQGGKLIVLAKHIALHGLNPAQRFIVIPDDDTHYIVLDANRRLAAIRAMENPDLVKDRISDSDFKQLKQLSENYDPPDDVPCIVFPKREEADMWLELLHQGESDGAGLVEWGAQQKLRHRGRSGKKEIHLQVLEFVRAEGHLSADTIRRIDHGKYAVSTLERALMTPYVRQKLGVDVTDGQVVTTFPKPEVLKGLSRLVDEIGARTVRVASFMSVRDRKKYIDHYKASDLPDPKTRMEIAASLEQAPEKGPPATKTKSKDKPESKKRIKLIPTEFAIDIPQTRIGDIFVELKRKLRVDEVPNATGALLRVFLELSVDHYMQANNVTSKDVTLAGKVTAVVNYMQSHEILSDKQAIPIREAVKSGDKVSLATNLNAIVHNPDMTLSGTDLKALWTRLERFSGKLWQKIEDEEVEQAG
jgi:hypothetical protein